ncbi:hypothetical protein HMPREF0620_0039 [Parascardovia denticolens DSM 10105 = JCM 12538]|uniref:Uncharacterized protein n=1 Tax=Parascardovia denticolens DSM 10105 = JCM 12538 TaxID=864564 RepID=E6JYH5_PARDN|nr:hypothetical protein [Parascardovia denticolens]EFT83034.1 hypothetical protein HMPREF0620_0039 [Parascardovia denticolens DSM 10105 = JCM 12538]
MILTPFSQGEKTSAESTPKAGRWGEKKKGAGMKGNEPAPYVEGTKEKCPRFAQNPREFGGHSGKRLYFHSIAQKARLADDTRKNHGIRAHFDYKEAKIMDKSFLFPVISAFFDHNS